MLFAQGGKGRVEGCQIWGNTMVGIGVHNSGTEAVVAGCKCASEGAPSLLFLAASAPLHFCG